MIQVEDEKKSFQKKMKREKTVKVTVITTGVFYAQMGNENSG
jgi:hypothetical protein